MFKPAAPLRGRLAVLALALGLGSAAAAAPPAPVRATGLAAGRAKGTLTVNARPVTLGYAYAALEPSPFDEKTNDIVILLTDRPVADDVLALQPLSDVAGAAGLKSYLQVKFREDKDQAEFFGFLGRWVVGHRWIGHEALKEMTLQSSPDFNAKVDAVVVSNDRVEATVYTRGPQADFDHKYEYRIAFNAAVRPRIEEAKEAKLDLGKAQRLPGGGGPPGRAYLAFNKAVATGDLKTVKAMAPPGPPMPDEQLKQMVRMMAALGPQDARVLEGHLVGDKAVLTVEAMVMGQKQKGTVEMLLAGGTWRRGKESWK